MLKLQVFLNILYTVTDKIAYNSDTNKVASSFLYQL